MKLLLVFSLSAIAFSAAGQVDQEEVLKNKMEELYRGGLNNEKGRLLLTPQKPGDFYFHNLETPLAQKPGIYSLPQDGMPCIVPHTSSIASIPNAFPKVSVPFVTTIPNAYQGPLPNKIITK
jgi:hypothetical protein